MMKKRGIFITGSGTDVGKTFVSKLLFECFSASGNKTGYMKPVQTGCILESDGEIIAPDARYVLSSNVNDINTIVPYRFEPACSPHLAASLAGTKISLQKITDTFLKLQDTCEVILVEGAGGVMVPFNNKEFTSDLIKALDIPAILITTPGLGTINHTLLSIDALRHSGVELIGIVINNAGNIARDFIYEDNVRFISEKSTVPCIETGYGATVDHNVKEFCDELKNRL